ncbi:MAG: elongation factor Ts [Candidatus Dependentiae bacterium]|nr:elongation factor Ts [Candidatus Dependentiae bacterium]
MTTISVDMIKKLRDATQVSMMDCKKALIDANGDFDKAVELLRKKGASVAAKRADNATNNGNVQVMVAPDFLSGTIVETACETDFSANTEDMRHFSQTVCNHVLATKTDTKAIVTSGEAITALMQEKVYSNTNLTLQGMLDELIAKIAESIKIARFAKMSTANGIVNGYVHAGSTLGVMVELAIEGSRPADITTLVQAAKDVAMQIAVTKPLCINPSELDQAVIAKETEIFAEQLRGEGKNAQIIEKIMPGKLSKFYETACLHNQKFIKDDKQTITQMLDAAGTKAGCKVRVARFVRFAIGQ